jgi:hypothetical protein
MMRPIFILQLLLTVSLVTYGESRFQKLYGDTLNDDLVRIIKASNGDYLLLGTVDLANSGSRKADIALYRTNQFGDLLNSYLIGDTSTNVPTDAVENSDGTYSICGYINDSLQNQSSRDFFLLRMDDAGTILWENTYGIAGTPDVVWCMTRSTDGGVFLAGSSDDHGLVCKADAFGQIVWSHRIDSLSGDNKSYFTCITPTFDGGCAVAGWRMVSSNWPNPMFTQSLIARFSDTGQPLWIRSLGDTFHSGWARDITFTPDGGFLITGTHDDNGTAMQFLTKVSSSGSAAWSHVYGNTGHHTDGTAVFDDSSGKIVLGGNCNQNGPYNSSLIITDSTGSLYHQWLYGTGSVRQIVDGFDGGYVLCGRYDGSPFQSDGYLIKTNDTGYTGCSEAAASFVSSPANYQTTPAGLPLICQLDQGFATLLVDPYINQFGQLCSWIGIDEREERIGTTVYPNPSSGIVFFRNTLGNAGRGEIHDLQGRCIRAFSFTSHSEFQLPTEELDNGCYLVMTDGYAPLRLLIRRQ